MTTNPGTLVAALPETATTPVTTATTGASLIAVMVTAVVMSATVLATLPAPTSLPMADAPSLNFNVSVTSPAAATFTSWLTFATLV